MNKTKTITWLIFIIISIFYCYEFFLRISPGILVEELLHLYHVNAIGIAAFSSSYYIGYVIMQIPAGVLFDRYPFKWVLCCALISCVIGALIFTNAHSFSVGVMGRFILGCGSAFAFVGALTFARKYLPENHFTLIIASVISLGTIVGAFGQIFAVKVIHYVGWHQATDAMAIWGIILVVAIALIGQRYFKAVDAIPAVTWHCISQQFKHLIKKPVIWLNGIIGSLFYLPTSVIAATWGIEFFTKQFGFTHMQGSYAITLLFIGWAVGGPCFGWLADEIGHERKIISVAAAFAAGLIAVVLFTHHLSAITLYSLLFCFGVASSAQVLVWHVFSVVITDKRLAGTASSFTNLLIMLSIAIWDLVLGKLINAFHHTLSAGSTMFTANDLRLALISLPLLLIVVIVLAQFLPKLSCQ